MHTETGTIVSMKMRMDYEHCREILDVFPILAKYHDTLFTETKQKLSGEKAVIRKMLTYWEYFSTTFPNPTKDLKKIKKAYVLYDAAVKEI